VKDHWNDYQSRWHLLEPPLRPHQDVIDTIVDAVGPRTSNVLLLGVTPELVERFINLTALDKSQEMIEALWHPSASTQVVREANWLDMDDRIGKFSAAVGDCSLNALQTPGEIDAVVGIVRARLLDGGVFACRVFERPETPIKDEDLQVSLDTGSHGNFHAFKWQIAMSLAERSGPSVKVIDILAHFDRLFPDRADVSEKTGWPMDVINTIDVYEHSSMSLVFPSRKEFEQYFSRSFKQVDWLAGGTYDLSERCPIVVAYA